MPYYQRRDGDSNPGTALDGYTLSRRASSATRASLHVIKLPSQSLKKWLKVSLYSSTPQKYSANIRNNKQTPFKLTSFNMQFFHKFGVLSYKLQ